METDFEISPVLREITAASSLNTEQQTHPSGRLRKLKVRPLKGFVFAVERLRLFF